MKLKNILLFASSAAVLASCNNSSSTKVSLDDDSQQVSYSFGYKLGENIDQTIGGYGQQLQALDTNIIRAGFIDYVLKNNPQMDTAKINELFMAFQTNPMKYSSKTYDEDLKKVVEESAKFLEEKSKDANVKKTASGLLYEVVKEGNSNKPEATSVVEVNYIGKLPDGTVFDQSQQGSPAKFPLNGVIKGWTEGLQLMGEGAKYKFYIPADLAYGDNPQPGSPIKAGHALEFEVELLKIEKK